MSWLCQLTFLLADIDKSMKEHKKTKHPIRKKEVGLQIGKAYKSIKQGHRAMKFLNEATVPVTRSDMVEVSTSCTHASCTHVGCWIHSLITP
jgi:hypothetical protein